VTADDQDGHALPDWLIWARDLQTIAQNGLTYAKDPFDVERYTDVRRVAAEILAAQGGLDATRVRDLLGREAGHSTPKVDVRAAVFRDETILLVRERSDGLWTLPGGWADPGEPPSVAVTREVVEESGYQTRATRLLAVYDRDLHGHPPLAYPVYKLFFACDLIGGAPAHSNETDGVDFFRADALPALSLSRVTPAQIARLFALQRNPDLPTEFD